jgi:hypothetical protein
MAGAKLVLLRVIESPYRELDWLGVGDMIEAEQQQEAQLLLDNHVRRAQDVAAGSPEMVIRKGDTAHEILKLIQGEGVLKDAMKFCNGRGNWRNDSFLGAPRTNENPALKLLSAGRAQKHLRRLTR